MMRWLGLLMGGMDTAPKRRKTGLVSFFASSLKTHQEAGHEDKGGSLTFPAKVLATKKNILGAR